MSTLFAVAGLVSVLLLVYLLVALFRPEKLE